MMDISEYGQTPLNKVLSTATGDLNVFKYVTYLVTWLVQVSHHWEKLLRHRCHRSLSGTAPPNTPRSKLNFHLFSL
jgi:hypothetical protein